MTVYLLGSRGPEVLKIQQQLSELQFYSGPQDGVFGGGTDSAVRAFQLSQQLQVDGKVGPGTWGALFNGADVPAPAVTKESLDRQCLALTGGVETDHPLQDCFAALFGDFDDIGMSFVVVHMNIGLGW